MPSETALPILVVNHTAQMGGAEYSLMDLLTGDPARYVVVLLEEGPFGERLRAAGIRTLIIPLPTRAASFRRKAGLFDAFVALLGLPKVVLALAEVARSSRLVYLSSQKAGVVGTIAAFLARRPSVWHMRTILDDYYGRLARRVTVALCNRLCVAVIANSAATGEAFVAAGGRRDKMSVIRNGFDAAIFGPDESVRRRMRTELGIPADARVAACLSRLTHWKGQHVLLEAVAGLPGMHVILVGDALFGGDAPYAESLHQRAAQADLAGRVHFLGQRTDIPDLLRAVDVVAVPSIESEAFGRVVIEAQLAGVPVVATNLGGLVESITPEVTGLLVPPNDARSLAEALVRLADDSDDVASMVASARLSAVSTFGLDRMRQEFGALFDRIRNK